MVHGLEMPDQLAGVPPERDEGVRIEIVPGSATAARSRFRVRQGEINQPELRIDGGRHPGISPAVQPRIPLPAAVTRLAGAGRRREAPGHGAIRRSERIQMTAHADRAAVLCADQEQPRVVERPRRLRAVSCRVLAWCADLDLPDEGSGLLVERDDMLAADSGEHAAAGHRDAPLSTGETRFVLPDDMASGAVHGEDVTLAGLKVEIAANRDRGALLR